jgi:stage II sporulation protein D
VLALGGLFSSLYAARPAAPAGGTTRSTTTSSPAATTVSTAPSVLAFVGHGYGHGLGMSQWGADGYARHGFTYNRILAHYYAGTKLARTKLLTLRVLVAQEAKTTIGAAGPYSVVDAGGTRVGLAAGSLTLGAALEVPGHPELSPPFSFTSPTLLSVDGHAYRGKLVVSSDGKRVTSIEVVGLEQYLKGVVPEEMPPTWPPDALEAQAVAARSYALANLVKSGPFDLYSDVRSQGYGGADVETAAASAAVDATKSQVLLYKGRIADTLFHSSSGGRTVSALEATGHAVPYLVSVADPYDALSPYHDWGPILYDAAAVAKQLRLSSPIRSFDVGNGASGRVRTLSFTGADDAVATFTGNQMRLELGLRSTWFRPMLLSLQPASSRMTYGGVATLTGTAAGVGKVSLEAKPSDGAAWSRAAALAPEAGGTFSTDVHPRVTTSYRLAFAGARVGLATVSVAPLVTASLAASGVVGDAQPSVAGFPVLLQQRQGSRWATVASTVSSAAGRFSFADALAAGVYRVRVAPGQGLAPGVSALLVVQ